MTIFLQHYGIALAILLLVIVLLVKHRGIWLARRDPLVIDDRMQRTVRMEDSQPAGTFNQWDGQSTSPDLTDTTRTYLLDGTQPISPQPPKGPSP